MCEKHSERAKWDYEQQWGRLEWTYSRRSCCRSGRLEPCTSQHLCCVNKSRICGDRCSCLHELQKHKQVWAHAFISGLSKFRPASGHTGSYPRNVPFLISMGNKQGKAKPGVQTNSKNSVIAAEQHLLLEDSFGTRAHWRHTARTRTQRSHTVLLAAGFQQFVIPNSAIRNERRIKEGNNGVILAAEMLREDETQSKGTEAFRFGSLMTHSLLYHITCMCVKRWCVWCVVNVLLNIFLCFSTTAVVLKGLPVHKGALSNLRHFINEAKRMM